MKLELWSWKIAEKKIQNVWDTAGWTTTHQPEWSSGQRWQAEVGDPSALIQQGMSVFSDVTSTDCQWCEAHSSVSGSYLCPVGPLGFSSGIPIDLVVDNTAEGLLQQMSLSEFWSKIVRSYSRMDYLAPQTLLLLISTYWCLSVF